MQEREKSELLQMYHRLSDPVWEDRQVTLFCLTILFKCNGVLLLLLIVPGFLPSRKKPAEQTPDPES